MTGLRDICGEAWIYGHSARVKAVHGACVKAVHGAEVFLLIKHVV